LPVYLYEHITGKKLTYSSGLCFENGRPGLNTLIIDYQIRSYELFDDGEYPVVTLSELLLLPEEVIVGEFLKNRIIVMGDFENDVHDTVFGSTPGTLILLNVFLTLLDKHELISFWWMLFLVAGYTVFSRIMLFPDIDPNGKHVNWVGPLLGSATYLSLFSVLSFMLFNQHIQVLVITLYINLLRFVIRIRKSEWSKSEFKQWLLDLRETYFNFK
jgi:hypothetical protein